VLTVIVTIKGMSICNVSSYCDNNDNNGEVYRQCKQIFLQ
jgi:hypothetical protein